MTMSKEALDSQDPRVRIIFQESKTKRFFLANLDRKTNNLNAMWSFGKGARKFTSLVEKYLGEKIDWKKNELELAGKKGEYTYWSHLEGNTVGIKLDLSKSPDINESLKMITQIASKNVIKGMTLPENLHSTLVKFVVSPPDTDQRISLK